jgi:hypothetical protein
MAIDLNETRLCALEQISSSWHRRETGGRGSPRTLPALRCYIRAFRFPILVHPRAIMRKAKRRFIERTVDFQ